MFPERKSAIFCFSKIGVRAVSLPLMQGTLCGYKFLDILLQIPEHLMYNYLYEQGG